MDACVDLQARSLRRAPGVADVVSSHACVCLGRPLWVVAARPPGYPTTVNDEVADATTINEVEDANVAKEEVDASPVDCQSRVSSVKAVRG